MFVKDNVGETNHAVQIREGEELRLSCNVNGNPVPSITISKEAGDSRILRRKASGWLHHTIDSSQCSDMGTYKCTGISPVFSKREKSFGINVICKLYTTSYFLKEKQNLKLMSLRYLCVRQNCQIFE